MARLREVEESAPGGADDLECRYHWLSRYGVAFEPGSEAGSVSRAILRERDRLDKKGDPVEVRLAALERFLDKHGWRDGAERLVAHLLAARARR
jgi:hypothetical protein